MKSALQAETPVDLTLRDAAALYDVTVKTLAQHLRCGQLAGYKSRGVTGREWRVSRQALEDAGYRRRGELADDRSGADESARLRLDLASAKHVASGERRRADDLDRRLGHALLECGRLRTALAAATGQPERPGAALDRGTADWLIGAITDGASLQRNAGRLTRSGGQRATKPGVDFYSD